MAIPTAKPPFCRLCIDTADTREAVQRLLDGLLGLGPTELRIFVAVSRNDGYCRVRRGTAARVP